MKIIFPLILSFENTIGHLCSAWPLLHQDSKLRTLTVSPLVHFWKLFLEIYLRICLNTFWSPMGEAGTQEFRPIPPVFLRSLAGSRLGSGVVKTLTGTHRPLQVVALPATLHGSPNFQKLLRLQNFFYHVCLYIGKNAVVICYRNISKVHTILKNFFSKQESNMQFTHCRTEIWLRIKSLVLTCWVSVASLLCP